MALTEIGKYRVLGELGRGAMGAVYLAEDPYIARRVAIKVMRPQVDEGPERFLQEARTIGALSHPNIVLLHDFGFVGELPYLVMELVEGEQLDHWLLASAGDRPPGARRRVIAGLCRAVAYAHERGVLHRDLKPSNVLVRPDGEAKLLDFGIARSGDTRHTATGIVLGTPEYLAPELLAGESFSVRSDLYSLGLVAYEIFGGRNPFRADTVAACLRRVVEVEPPPLSADCGASPEVAAAIMACLAKEPAARPSGVEPLLAALEAPADSAALPRPVAAHAAPTRRLEAAPPPRRSPTWRIGLAGAAVAVLALVAWLGWPDRPGGSGPAAPRSDPATLQAAASRGASSPRLEPAIRPQPTATPLPAEAQRTRTTEHVAPRLEEPESGGAGHPSRTSGRDEPGTPVVAPPTPGASAVTQERPAESAPFPLLPAPAPSAVVATEPTPTAIPLVPEVRIVPRLLAITPSTLRRGDAATMRVRGEGLGSSWVPSFRHGGRAVSQIRLLRTSPASSSELVLSLLVEEDAPIGTYSFLLIDASGATSNQLSFEVDL